MEIQKRPVSIIIIGWIIIVTGVASIAVTPMILTSTGQRGLDTIGMPVAVGAVWSFVGGIISLVAGIAILKGLNWGRLLYLCFSPISIVLGWILYGFRPTHILTVFFYLVILGYLTRPIASAFFRKTNKELGKVAIVLALFFIVIITMSVKQNKVGGDAVPTEFMPEQLTGKGLPVMIDLGSDQCIPCKMMAPILEELKTEYAKKLTVHFLDVRKMPALSKIYGIQLIPTQIFYDASGKELFRHEGFCAKEDIIAKWKQFGVELAGPAAQMPAFERLVPAQADNRTKDQICYMCDGDINNKTLVTVQTDKGPVRLCSPHCYFIMYSCLTEDKTGFENKVSVIDWSTGKSIPATNTVYVYDMNSETGRPVIKAFADKGKAETEQKTASGSIISLEILKDKELATRCGFCDRAVYPQDAAPVIAGGLHTWGCCSHCALGVAARTGKDIEVHEKDRLTDEEIIVKTLDGKIASLEPLTAVAWFGQRQKPDGTWGSAGCFHQGFFVNPDNLKKWVEQNPYETGRLISISQALADKMKLTPQQIQKACKIGECVPK